MRTEQDRLSEAKEVLASAYDKFTEGFETADLVSARDLLHQLT